MTMAQGIIFDVEADGLLEDATKIHCLSYTRDGKSIYTTYDYDYMRRIIGRENVLIGHNIIRYDVPLLEKILGIKIKKNIISHMKIEVPTFKSNKLPDFLKSTPITIPGSRFIK